MKVCALQKAHGKSYDNRLKWPNKTKTNLFINI